MKKATEVERDEISKASSQDNVLTINFSRRFTKETESSSGIDHSLAHPASKWFPEEGDDPLEDLLNEFNDLTDDVLSSEDILNDIFTEEETHEDYIHHHQDYLPKQVSFKDEPKNIADNILAQMMRLKEDSKRMKYYLDELNLDKR